MMLLSIAPLLLAADFTPKLSDLQLLPPTLVHNCSQPLTLDQYPSYQTSLNEHSPYFSLSSSELSRPCLRSLRVEERVFCLHQEQGSLWLSTVPQNHSRRVRDSSQQSLRLMSNYEQTYIFLIFANNSYYSIVRLNLQLSFQSQVQLPLSGAFLDAFFYLDLVLLLSSYELIIYQLDFQEDTWQFLRKFTPTSLDLSFEFTSFDLIVQKQLPSKLLLTSGSNLVVIYYRYAGTISVAQQLAVDTSHLLNHSSLISAATIIDSQDSAEQLYMKLGVQLQDENAYNLHLTINPYKNSLILSNESNFSKVYQRTQNQQPKGIFSSKDLLIVSYSGISLFYSTDVILDIAYSSYPLFAIPTQNFNLQANRLCFSSDLKYLCLNNLTNKVTFENCINYELTLKNPLLQKKCILDLKEYSPWMWIVLFGLVGVGLLLVLLYINFRRTKEKSIYDSFVSVTQ